MLVFWGVVGVVFGSFGNVLVWRLNDEKAPKWWRGRSVCPLCKHSLAWMDNIPLVSFLFLAGKCRYCQKKISLRYPVVEIGTAVLFGGVWFLSRDPLLLGIAFCLWIIFVSDWTTGLIPDELVVVGSGLSVLRLLGDLSILKTNLITGIAASAFFLSIVLATKFRGMGLGDVKLAFFMGLLLGPLPSLVAFWSAFLLGGGFAVGLLLLKRKGIRDTIALGPFLVLGVLISALWSNVLLKLVIP